MVAFLHSVTTKNSFMVNLAGFAKILLQWILQLCN